MKSEASRLTRTWRKRSSPFSMFAEQPQPWKAEHRAMVGLLAVHFQDITGENDENPIADPLETYQSAMDSLRKCDTEKLLALAEHHRVLAPLGSGLEAYEKRTKTELSESSDFQVLLKSKMKNLSGQFLKQKIEIKMLAAKFKDAGIEFLAYRGPVMEALINQSELESDTHYTVSAPLRQSDDLNFFIERKNVKKIATFLRTSGYELVHDNPDLLDSAEKMKNENQFVFTRDDEGQTLQVELRVQLDERKNRLPITFRKAWAKHQEVEFSGLKIPTFSNADTFMILCNHGQRHLWQKLIWVFDVARFIKHQQENLPAILQYCADNGRINVSQSACMLANRLLLRNRKLFSDADDDIRYLAKIYRQYLFHEPPYDQFYQHHYLHTIASDEFTRRSELIWDGLLNIYGFRK